MKQQLEIEFKMLVSKEQFDKITALYRPLLFLKQHNYYYKSPSSLQSFRIRIKEDKKIFTLKDTTGDQIIEYEKEFFDLFYEDSEIKKLLNKLNIYPPFYQVGELTTYRATIENDLAELCFDINCYNGLLDYEIEYEMKTSHEGLSTFKEILSSAGIGYIPCTTSKYMRCISTKGE